ncbi:AmmeMemoRadiSam system radical SAM enzyme [Abyssisolibacter fermentans]|uniref:AmmeMemoRadiSam system radical SAM enzyme n=1 Tax=Abyssisolibacter fermentans TaxID=1766203 RepID=UPI00082FE1A0|nr:AmmeMemoRadiSam system radical SAM enzyme [Abyssisolibacter fermentans]
MNSKLVEALYYQKGKNDSLRCKLCPHNCLILPNGVGICKVRKNIDGELYTLNYGAVTAYHIDPIEKKPLYNYYPGHYIFSVGSFGCNLKCSFCQNFEIAHEIPSYKYVSPKELVEIASSYENNLGIAFTYNEPSIWYEYILDTAKISKAKGLKNILVSNGYIEKQPLEELLKYIDAMNIDLKAFSNEFYLEICKGSLEEVKDNIKIAAEKCHIEISTLLIDDLNTSKDEIIGLCKWLASVDENIPLHLNRYYPSYKMNNPATKVETIMKLRDVAKKYLYYVYAGNIFSNDKNTYCPNCGALIVKRSNNMKLINFKNGKCVVCGYKLNIIV